MSFALAILGSSLAFSIALSLFFALVDGGVPDLSFALTLLIFTFVGSTVIIAAAALFVGLPLTWVFASNRMETDWIYALSGFVAGAAVLFLFALWTDPLSLVRMSAPPWPLLFGALPGALCGWLWWQLDRRHMQPSGDRSG